MPDSMLLVIYSPCININKFCVSTGTDDDKWMNVANS
jgi:hypothetical protein